MPGGQPHANLDVGGKGSGEQAKADRLESEIQSAIQQPTVQMRKGLGEGGGESYDFPTRPIPKDPYDGRFALKREMLKDNPITGGPVQLHATLDQADIDWLERKRKISNSMQFQRWMLGNIDWDDPNSGKNGKQKKKAPAPKDRKKAAKSAKRKPSSGGSRY